MAEVEYDVKLIFLDANYQANVQKFQQEGWMMQAETPPFAIFPVVRMKGQPGMGGEVNMTVDETKVDVMVKDAAGNLVPKYPKQNGGGA